MENNNFLGTATYSPEDNKLRFYPFSRLSKEDYLKIKANGFIWAPKQELFVAPMWTPSREDFLVRWCGEIGDEDKSLVDRQEERAERFENYSDRRAGDAEAAHKRVEEITSYIPLGQPILIGHHSEKRARKDAQKIENNMRYAIKMWETSEYWKERAAGAIHHAKYKELPTVRARRIKRIEADKRKREREKTESEKWLKLWSKDGLTLEEGIKIAEGSWLHMPKIEGDRKDWNQNPTAYDTLTNSYPSLYAPRTIEQVIEHAKRTYPANIAYYERWINHYENRLIYEKAMLEEQGQSKLIEKKPRPKQLPLCNYKTDFVIIENRWNRGEYRCHWFDKAGDCR